MVLVLLRCRAQNADVLCSSLNSVRAIPGSVGRWRASAVEIPLDMMWVTRVAPPAASGLRVATRTGSLLLFHNIRNTIFFSGFQVFWQMSVYLGFLAT